MLDGFSFDPFSLFDDGIGPGEVGVGRRHIVQALMISLVVVMFDERLDLVLKVTRQGSRYTEGWQTRFETCRVAVVRFVMHKASMSARNTIVLFAEPAVIVPAFCTVVSALRFKPPCTDVRVFCVNFDQGEFETAVQAFSALDPSVAMTQIDSAKDFDDSVWRTQLGGMGTWGRLFLDRFLPGELNRVLYLDCDTLVLRHLALLLEANLETCSVGACKDQFQYMHGTVEQRRKELGLSPKGDYFNAGVLLFDWQRVIGRNVLEQTRDQLRISRGSLPLNFADQDILNLMLDGNWCELNPGWNLMSFSLAVTQSRQPRILHFAGPRKPWSNRCPFHLKKFGRQYDIMLRKAGPFAQDFVRPPSTMRIYSRHLRNLLRQAVKHRPLGKTAHSLEQVTKKHRIEAVFKAYDQKCSAAH